MISGYTYITGPLILEMHISEYTDIAALSCDIGLLRIYGLHISYPISQFQISDIGTFADIANHDIRVSQISEFLMSYLICVSPADPGFPDAPVRTIIDVGHNSVHSGVFTSATLTTKALPRPALQLQRPAVPLPRPGPAQAAHRRRQARPQALNASCQH